ncbi:MAG: nucleotidyl transferase AbiEii/AbiGii toxin family protein [Muribaculaceae bacterium]
MKNIGKSIRSRLLNIKNASSHNYMYLLSRYFNERLLYRISISRFNNSLILKGGSLIYAFEGLKSRPTVDVDFLATNISREQTILTKAIIEILSIECPDDGVVFDTSNIKYSPITVDKKYPGSRFSFNAHLDTIVFPMSIDIGFGDIISNGPISLDYPTILEGLPPISLKAYSLETLVAEKFHTMIDRDVTNSRMKDFFDCYQLIKNKHLNDSTLQEAILQTFTNRNLLNKPHALLFDPKFYEDIPRVQQWRAFLRRIQYPEHLDFSIVVNTILEALLPKAEKVWRH